MQFCSIIIQLSMCLRISSWMNETFLYNGFFEWRNLWGRKKTLFLKPAALRRKIDHVFHPTRSGGGESMHTIYLLSIFLNHFVQGAEVKYGIILKRYFTLINQIFEKKKSKKKKNKKKRTPPQKNAMNLNFHD